MRMVVTADKATVYGKALVAGDEFECPEKEAKLWSALARAKPADGLVTDGWSLGFSGDPQAANSEGSGRRRRHYNRRDMRAEG